MEENEITTYSPLPDKMDARAEAEKIIKDHTIWSMGAGLVPIPLLDIAAVTAIQLDMVKKISALYEQDFSEQQAKAWVSSFAASAGARLAADAIKLIPGFGTVLGGITMSGLSGATTYAIGAVFVRHFESGGTYLNFDPTKFKDYFNEQMQAGKDYVKNLTRNKKADANQPPPKAKTSQQSAANSSNNADEVYQKLEKLAALHKAGIIDEAEFTQLKQKLIAEL